MMNLLFSPSGRIGPSAYMKGIIVIAIIGAILGVLPLLSPAFGALGIVGFVTFYIFIALGIKRSHDAGKSGWMVLTHILLSFGVGAVALFLVGLVTGVSLGDVFGAAFSGDIDAAEAAAETVEGPMYVIASVVLGFIGQLVTGFLVNMFNPQDAGDNQWGPVPVA
ncbi:MAG: DUF805 domain-containing protein [Pseudomonadota bacterium]